LITDLLGGASDEFGRHGLGGVKDGKPRVDDPLSTKK
jgi:hypothetical protein